MLLTRHYIAPGKNLCLLCYCVSRYLVHGGDQFDNLVYTLQWKHRLLSLVLLMSFCPYLNGAFCLHWYTLKVSTFVPSLDNTNTELDFLSCHYELNSPRMWYYPPLDISFTYQLCFSISYALLIVPWIHSLNVPCARTSNAGSRTSSMSNRNHVT
jgi:hypothetical protein